MKNQPRKGLPSVFALAGQSQSITAEIDVDDVLAVHRDWTRERAGRFLAQHGGDIGADMIQAGMARLIALAGRSSQDVH